MSYKTLLVHLDTSARAQARLDLALRLARRSGAHVTGLFAAFLPDARDFYVMAGSAGYYDAHRKLLDEQRGAIERLFHAELQRANVAGEWIAATQYAEEAVLRHARYADLVIAGQTDPDDPATYVADRFPESLVMGAGRPVLMVPYAGHFESVGRHVLVAWDGGREAARAVQDALPLLVDAERVTVLCVSPPGAPPLVRAPGADIAVTLARHGVNVDFVELNHDLDETTGDALLSYAAETRYDLLVMGAYGHARWTELVLGGVTRTMFNSMTLPVLMAH